MKANKPAPPLRVFFLPFFASGHMIPMADLAVLFSRHPNVDPTLCLTPANAAFLRPSLPSAVAILTYPFPSEAAGLPPGVENLSSVSRDQEWKMYRAVDLSRPAHRDLLHLHRPDAVIADIPFWWTTEIAAELRIPRITWPVVGVFPQLVWNSLHNHLSDTLGRDGAEIVRVKDLPGPQLEMPVSELPEFVQSTNFLTEAWPALKKAEREGYGVVVNTFYGFEPVYCDHKRETDCRRSWFVGPVALARARAGDVDAEQQLDDVLLSWLDGKEEEGSTVVFVCFGSQCHFKEEQLREIAIGLEKSGCSFLWTVRASGGDNWLPDEGWERRISTGGQGKVVRGWAPQVKILGHNAVGAFLTHCGWNSVLESVALGVPMLTWPLAFEQFITERLVVELTGMGERVWTGGVRSTREEERVVVPGEAIARVVSRFMQEEKSTGRWGKLARKHAQVARAAVAEGGTSSEDLKGLIHELRLLKNNRSKEEEEAAEE